MGWKYYLPEAEQTREVREQLDLIQLEHAKWTAKDIKVIDKTTPRLLQSHTIENAVKPPFLGGFFISSVMAA